MITEDQILQALANELRGTDLICELVPMGQSVVQGKRAVSKIIMLLELYHHVEGGPQKGVRRFTVRILNGKIIANETSGQAKLGTRSFELVDPQSVDKLLTHIHGRLAHWALIASMTDAEIYGEE